MQGAPSWWTWHSVWKKPDESPALVKQVACNAMAFNALCLGDTKVLEPHLLLLMPQGCHAAE
jgi:hypothetical protein